ncbi:MAG: alkene reductase [Planctomycetota bacterium]
MTTSNKDRSPLLDPIQLGAVQLRNRVAMAPMTRSRAGEEGMPNAMMAEYYRQRASAGLIITEATSISDEGRGWLNTPRIENQEHVEAWKPIVDTIHEEGGTVFMQLWHTGRASHSSFHAGGALPVAASAVKHRGKYIHTPNGKQDYEVPRALETGEIPRVVDDYAKAAERAKQAGFDGVEIHAANGYLIDTFLQSHTNQREDAYGGSLENRFRFLGEVTEAVSSVFNADRVGVRLGPNTNYNDMGAPDYREAFLYFAKSLDPVGLAYLHVLDGTSFGWHDLGEPVALDEVRAVYGGLMMGNTGYDQAAAEKALRAGSADMIAFGRPFITNPDLVDRFANHWPLAAMPETSIWYSSGSEGYTDFPRYQDPAAEPVSS